MRWLPGIAAPGHVGISFGRRWINLAVVTRRGETYQVTAVEALPAEERGRIPEAVARMNAKGLPATFSLSEREVRRERLALPPLPKRELPKVVIREAGLGPADAWAWQARAVPQGGWDVEVRAVPRETLQALVQEADAADLSLVDVVPHGNALIAALSRPGEAAGELISLMEVWDHASILVLARDQSHVYDRHIPRGYLGRPGAAPEPAPQAEAAVPPPPPEAEPDNDDLDFGDILLALDEDALEHAALPGSEPEAAPAPEPVPVAPESPPEPPPGPGPEVQAEWERLAEELHRTHLFAKKNLKAGDVARTVLAGPFAEDERFVAWLSERMRVTVAPFGQARPDVAWPGPTDPRMALPIGAALAGLAPAPGHARLVPPEMRRREVRPTLSYAAAALLVFALASAGLSVLVEARAVARQEADVAVLRKRVAGMEAMAARESAPPPLVGPDGARRPLPAGVPGFFPGTALLDALGRAMPSDARLLDLSAVWKDGAWHVTAEGEVLAAPVDALRAVGDLTAALDRSGRFSDVALSPVAAAGSASTPFELTLTLGGGHAHHP
jgi:hypothetical protein